MGKVQESNKDDIKFDPELDIAEQIKKLIINKRRNLEKRKNKLEEYKKRATHEKLLPEQEEALKSFDSVHDTLITIQHLLDQMQVLCSQQARWLKKEQKANLKKQAALKTVKQSEEKIDAVVNKENVPIPSEVEALKDEVKPSQPEPVPQCTTDFSSIFSKSARIYRLLQCFGEDDVRSLFTSSAQENSSAGVVPLSEQELGWLDELSDMLSPLATLENASEESVVDVFGCHSPLSTRKVQEILDPVFQQLSLLLSSSDEPMLSDGATFKQVNELCTRLVECDFFINWTPKPVTQKLVDDAPVMTTDNYVDHIKPSTATTFENVHGTASVIDSTSSQPVHINSTANGGGVERMLQTLGNAYQFLQIGPSEIESQDPAKFIHSNVSGSLPAAGTAYWASEEQNSAPQQMVHSTTGVLGSQRSNLTWNAEDNADVPTYPEESHLRAPSAYEPIENGKQVHDPVEMIQPPVGVNHSWADRVRLKYANKETSGPKSSFDNPSCFPANNGDVFSTATQSQFISNSVQSDRRGGRGSSRGYSSGFRGRDNYRGSGNGYPSQRGRGRSSGQRF